MEGLNLLAFFFTRGHSRLRVLVVFILFLFGTLKKFGLFCYHNNLVYEKCKPIYVPIYRQTSGPSILRLRLGRTWSFWPRPQILRCCNLISVLMASEVPYFIHVLTALPILKSWQGPRKIRLLSLKQVGRSTRNPLVQSL